MTTQLTLFFDGACPLCRREINHYKKKDAKRHLIEFIDITSPPFKASDYDLDDVALHAKMHVKKANGQVVTGVDSFLAIWELFPEYRWLKKLVGNPFVKPLAHVGYWCFAKVRPYLPGRKEICNDDVCQRK